MSVAVVGAWAAWLASLVGAVAWAVWFRGRRAWAEGLGMAGTGLGFLFQTGSLFGVAWLRRGWPVTSVGEAFTFLAWALWLLVVAGLAAGAGARRGSARAVAVFAMPLVVACATVGVLAGGERAPWPAWVIGRWAGVHPVLTLLGYAACAVGCASAVMYLLLARQLKQKHTGSLFQRLPSLERLEDLTVHAVQSGVVLLAAGLGTGTWAARGAPGGVWRADPKMAWALLTLLLYSGVAAAGTTPWLRGRRLAVVAAAVFAVIVYTFVGVEHLGILATARR